VARPYHRPHPRSGPGWADWVRASSWPSVGRSSSSWPASRSAISRPGPTGL
jgi:hypothetical protein